MHRSGEEHRLVGMFDTADAAARAYDQAALKMHGPEAYTNFLCKCCCCRHAVCALLLLLLNRDHKAFTRVQDRTGGRQERAGGAVRGFRKGAGGGATLHRHWQAVCICPCSAEAGRGDGGRVGLNGDHSLVTFDFPFACLVD